MGNVVTLRYNVPRYYYTMLFYDISDAIYTIYFKAF